MKLLLRNKDSGKVEISENAEAPPDTHFIKSLLWWNLPENCGAVLRE
jgi:hypothetical protein